MITDEQKKIVELFLDDYRNIIETLRVSIPLNFYYKIMFVLGVDMIQAEWKDAYFEYTTKSKESMKIVNDDLDRLTKRLDGVLEKK